MKIELSGPVRSNAAAQDFDIRQIKAALNKLGLYIPLKEVGMVGIPDQAMFDALRQFQSNQGLPATGEARPGDETVQALNSEANKPRTGSYIWNTVGDDKVRASHAALEGQVRSWDDDPDPAEEVNCRCWAVPVNKADGLKQKVVSEINDAEKQWDTFDFAYKFWIGDGSAVTLPEIGHLGGIIDKAREIIFKRLESQVAAKMREIKSGPLIYRTENSYPGLIDVHWVLGGGTIATLTSGVVTRNENVLFITATVDYKYFDEVTDPIDIRELYRDPHRIKDLPNSFVGGAELRATDLAGKAYAITGEWQTELTGSILLKEE